MSVFVHEREVIMGVSRGYLGKLSGSEYEREKLIERGRRVRIGIRSTVWERASYIERKGEDIDENNVLDKTGGTSGAGRCVLQSLQRRG